MEVVRHLFDCLVKWWAPMLPFTMEEAWLDRHPGAQSVHLEQFPEIPGGLEGRRRSAEKWRKVRHVRRVVTGALEIERAKKAIGSSLEAAPVVYARPIPTLEADIAGVDLAEIAITSEIAVIARERAPAGAFALDDVPGVAVAVAWPRLAGLVKCARSWRLHRTMSATIRSIPTCRRAMPACCANLRRLGRL